jgi:hypothetical protein
VAWSVSPGFTANTALCDVPQLIVNQRSQLIERGSIAGMDAGQQFRDDRFHSEP